jgi:hypothetical protein
MQRDHGYQEATQGARILVASSFVLGSTFQNIWLRDDGQGLRLIVNE